MLIYICDSGIDSKASIERRNSDRQAAGITSMRRRRRGKKPDMIFSYDTLELGCTEAGLNDDGPSGTKEIKESVLKIPKELKNMLLRLVAVAPQNRHDINTIGFIISGRLLSIHAKILTDIFSRFTDINAGHGYTLWICMSSFKNRSLRLSYIT